MDGVGFHVDLSKIDEAATGIAGSVSDQARAGLDDLPEVDGDAELRDVFRDFCDRWSHGLDILIEDTEAIGETLTRVAAIYRSTDESAARSMTGDPAVEAVND